MMPKIMASMYILLFRQFDNHIGSNLVPYFFSVSWAGQRFCHFYILAKQ